MNPEWISTTFHTGRFFNDYIESAKSIGYEVRDAEDSIGGVVLVANDEALKRYEFRCTCPWEGKVEIRVLNFSDEPSALVKKVFDPVTNKWFQQSFSLSDGPLRSSIQSWK